MRARSYAKITIAARWPHSARVDWFDDMVRELGLAAEPKSELLRERISENARARQRLNDEVQGAEIFIVDPFDHLRELLEPLGTQLGFKDDPGLRAWRLINSGSSSLRPLAQMLLETGRARAISGSMIPGVEGFLGRAITQCGLHSSPKELLDRRELVALNEQDFREVVSRFTVALADVLDLDAIATEIAKQRETRTFVDMGEIATTLFERQLGVPTVFDAGRLPAWRLIERAHDLAVRDLNWRRRSPERFLPGGLAMEDSARFRGLQLADIAAAMSRELFEAAFPETPQASAAVRTRFPRVLVNTTWLP